MGTSFLSLRCFQALTGWNWLPAIVSSTPLLRSWMDVSDGWMAPETPPSFHGMWLPGGIPVPVTPPELYLDFVPTTPPELLLNFVPTTPPEWGGDHIYIYMHIHTRIDIIYIV